MNLALSCGKTRRIIGVHGGEAATGKENRKTTTKNHSELLGVGSKNEKLMENIAMLFYPLFNQVEEEYHQGLNMPITSDTLAECWLLGNMLQTVVECLWPITPSMGRVEESCWLLHHDRDKSFGLGTPLSVVLWYVHRTWNPLPVWDGKSVMVFSRQLTWKQQKLWVKPSCTVQSH